MEKNLTANPVCALVRWLEQNFINGNTLVSKYVTQNPYEDINKIEAYLNSKHTSGERDSLGREKPFFNIVVAARNICFRATDLDRKDVRIKATETSNILAAFIATLFLQQWMTKNNFGSWLNTWGLNLAAYNSSVVKFVEQDNELVPIVPPWDKLIFDVVDFDNNPKIEILELTPAQLRKRKGYDQDIVEKLIETTTARKIVGGQNKDTKSDYIRLYEIHGNLPLSYLTGKDKDDDEYVQQMHVITFVGGKNKGSYDDFTLVSGKEEKDPYLLTALLPSIDGSVSFDGSVKNLFDSQWMVNHTAKQIKDQLDLASMLIFQTSDGNYVGQNALTSLVTGDIMIHAPNQPLTQLQNNSHDITALQNFSTEWRNLAQEITSTPDVLMGKNMPSGTAYRQAAILQQQSMSNYEIMTENKGLYLEKILRLFVIPFIKKQLKNKDQIVASLNKQHIDKIDSLYIPNEVNQRTNQDVVKAILNNEPMNPQIKDQMMMNNTEAVKSELNQMGDSRFLVPDKVDQKTWDNIFKDLEWEVETNITGEVKDVNTVLTTLSELLGTVAKNPAILQDPKAKLLFNKILTESSVISPAELNDIEQQSLPSAVGGSALPTMNQQ